MKLIMENWRQYLTESREFDRRCLYYWKMRHTHELLDNDYKDRDDLDYISMAAKYMYPSSEYYRSRAYQNWSPRGCDQKVIDRAREDVEAVPPHHIRVFHKMVKVTNQHVVAPQQAKELFDTSDPPIDWCQIIKNLPILFRESNPVNEYRNFALVFNKDTGKLSRSTPHKKYLSCLEDALEEQGYIVTDGSITPHSVGSKEFLELINEMQPIKGFDYHHPQGAAWRAWRVD